MNDKQTMPDANAIKAALLKTMDCIEATANTAFCDLSKDIEIAREQIGRIDLEKSENPPRG